MYEKCNCETSQMFACSLTMINAEVNFTLEKPVPYTVKVSFEAALLIGAAVGLEGQSSGMCVY